jgi:hypothetical protein
MGPHPLLDVADAGHVEGVEADLAGHGAAMLHRMAGFAQKPGKAPAPRRGVRLNSWHGHCCDRTRTAPGDLP